MGEGVVIYKLVIMTSCTTKYTIYNMNHDVDIISPMVLPGIFSALWLQTQMRPQGLDSINRKVDWHRKVDYSYYMDRLLSHYHFFTFTGIL
jgi:hypothetical protein